MIRFGCDYQEGAVPEIMDALIKTNYEQTAGYSEDEYTEKAKTLIKERCGRDDVDVHILVGGTQTNLTFIASALRPHQAVISADTGHISVHETGAIEATGHKVITIPSFDGKIKAEEIAAVVDGHWADGTHEHIAQPAMVYISQPTENGTVYSLEEMTKISEVCRGRDVLLYVDGARLGTALVCENNELFIKELAELSDAFYIGGTKLGALFGEALVIVNDKLKKDFRYIIKQRGGMFAKGRLLGIQFVTLMQDGLYEKIAMHEVEQAMRIRRAFEAKGIKMYYDSTTNQQFPIITEEQHKKLAENYVFADWCKTEDGMQVIRFCTAWATKTEDVDTLIADIEAL